MKIYFAGIPGGGQKKSERRIIKAGGRLRLASFYYLSEALITMKEGYSENILCRNGRDYMQGKTTD